MVLFPTSRREITDRVNGIDPMAYSRDRNFLNGHVTKLSPYISRGVITTAQILNSLKERGYSWQQCEKLVQELCWRDYFQRIWQSIGTGVDKDIKNVQSDVRHHEVPKAIADARTGIDAIDLGIQVLLDTGYMHNHLRMYVASITCNVGRSHWRQPAHWMYYHLLDADWASNACSWQWVSGAFSSKKYFANQENINKYCNSKQRNTFLDVEYDAFDNPPFPDGLHALTTPKTPCILPPSDTLTPISGKKVLIYNWYNLDPDWQAGEDVGRILLLEPSVFSKYPVSNRSIGFMLALARNIEGIQIFTGEFDALRKTLPNVSFVYKEHPLNQYEGKEEARDFISDYMFNGQPGFFSYWKKLERQLSHAWS
jgi:deoxyribodipyrimidine photo-lyase